MGREGVDVVVVVGGGGVHTCKTCVNTDSSSQADGDEESADDGPTGRQRWAAEMLRTLEAFMGEFQMTPFYRHGYENNSPPHKQKFPRRVKNKRYKWRPSTRHPRDPQALAV